MWHFHSQDSKGPTAKTRRVNNNNTVNTTKDSGTRTASKDQENTGMDRILGIRW